MYTDTEGIVLRQIKTINSRRMVLLFSRKYGKISAGSGISVKGRGKSALAMRPFTLGRYELYKGRDTFNINGAETLKSYYGIGEDVDKYMSASYVLELTDKLTTEGQPVPQLFELLNDFLREIEHRDQDHGTLVAAFETKALKAIGYLPELRRCVICGNTEDAAVFSIKDGGIVCNQCIKNNRIDTNDTLIYDISFGIVDVLRYFLDNPLESLENLRLDEKRLKDLRALIKHYTAYYLDLGELKSETFLTWR